MRRDSNETLPVEQALNRITAEPVFAKLSSPHYHGSAMDGICVRAENTFGATEFSPKAPQSRGGGSSGRMRLRSWTPEMRSLLGLTPLS